MMRRISLLVVWLLLAVGAHAQVGVLRTSNNLSDVGNTATALSHLGGVAATGGALTSGSVDGSAIGQATVNLGIASGRTITYSGSPPRPQNNSDLWLFDYVNGAASTQLNWNLIDVENTSSSGTALNNALLINQNFGGGTGGYSGLYVINNQVASTANANGYYTTGTFVAQAAYNDNGTSGAYSGHLYGLNPNCRTLNGATYWDQVVCQEIDIAASAGSSVNDLIGLQIVNLSGALAPTPTHTSAALVIAGVTGNDGTPLFNLGMSLGAYEGVSGVKSTGTYIGCYPHANTGSCGTLANGVDLRNITFTGYPFASPNFSVDTYGNTAVQTVQAINSNTALTLEGNGTGSVTVGSTTRGIDWAWGTGNNTAIANRGNDYGSASGGGFVMRGVSGSDTTIQQILQAGGTGFNAFQFWDGANKSLLGLNSVTGSVNSLTVSPAVTGSAPAITASGADTNVSLNLATKGMGTIQINGVSQSAYSASPLFGTGADGTVTISSGVTTLSRDMHYANLTLSGTGAINANGFRIFVSGTADFSAAATGAIFASGAAGAAASGATAGIAATITGYGGTVPVTPLVNGAGGAGSTTTGTASAAAASIVVGLGGIGGQGGSGGASTSAGGAAGAGGVIYNTLLLPAPAPSLTAVSGLNAFVEGALFGSGGGGGGGDATNSGGGGGGGGGPACTVQIYARVIQRGANTNTSIISAKGGAGGAGAAAVGGSAAGGGGGGGGGGGAIYIVTESLLGSAIANALDVSGGNGASGGNGLGTGKGGAGGTGGATGRVHVITLNPASVGTTANVANGGTVSGTTYGYSAASAVGTAGSTTSTTTGGAGGAGAAMKVGL